MKTFRQLLEDIQVGPAPEEISYKGYTTKNLHHVPDATKAFQATITRVQKGTLEDKGEVLAALKATDTYMRLNDMHLEQEKDLDSQELDQWLASHEEAKSALTKIGEFEHHYDYWNSHNAELQYLKANQNMPQEAESVQIEEGPYSSGQLKASPEQLKQANKVPSGGRTTTIVDRDAKGVYTLTMKDGKEVSKVYKESTEIGEASKLQGTPVVSLSDFGSKDNTKNKYGQTVPKKLKPNDPRVKMYTEPKKEGVAEAQSTKTGIYETDVLGAKAYHAKCMEPNCKWESKRFDRIKQAHAAAEKHAKDHFKQGVAEGLHSDYVFHRVQSGYWGSTHLDKKVVVKAASKDEAHAKIRQRKDFVKKLRNGDTVSWRLAEGYKEPTDAAGHAKMAAKIKKILDDTLADRGDRHGNPDPERLTRAYEYHMEKAKEKSRGVSEGLADDFLAMAKNRNPNARIVTAVQKRKEADELMKKREASGTKPAQAAPTSNTRPLGGHDPKSGRSYSESVEPIDELSKTTLGSYIKKRSHDVATQGAATRQHAVDAAKEKEAQGGYTTSSVRDKEQKADKAFMKGWKQRMNIAKAVDRLTKEEVEETEQIDEISAEVKQKYLAAATKKHLQQFLGRAPVRDKQELDKRRAAIQKTSKELTGKTHYQESVETVEEASDTKRPPNFKMYDLERQDYKILRTPKKTPPKDSKEWGRDGGEKKIKEEVELEELRNVTQDQLGGRMGSSGPGFNKTPAGKAREVKRKQEHLKGQMQFTKSQGGIAGPKGKLPEEVELEEKTLTPAELKKREEIAKAMERKNPNMDMSRKMAIATAVAKRVAEQYDDAE